MKTFRSQNVALQAPKLFFKLVRKFSTGLNNRIVRNVIPTPIDPQKHQSSFNQPTLSTVFSCTVHAQSSINYLLIQIYLKDF